MRKSSVGEDVRIRRYLDNSDDGTIILGTHDLAWNEHDFGGLRLGIHQRGRVNTWEKENDQIVPSPIDSEERASSSSKI